MRGLTAACLTAALMPLNSTMIAVAVPTIAHDLGYGEAAVTQALVATYLVTAIALQSPGGKLGDRIGHWHVFSLGQTLLAAGTVLGFLAPDLLLLACSRVLMAAGGAVVVPATLALLRLELPAERRGRAFGAFGAVAAFAAAVGPLLGGELVGAFGWRSVFLVNLPVLVVSAGLAATARRPAVARPASTGAFDWPGSLLLAAALATLITGLQEHGAVGIALILVGAALSWPFWFRERRAADPVIAFGLFRSRRFTAGSLVVALLNLVLYTLIFEVPQLTHALFGLDAQATGRLLLFLTLALAATSLVAGRLVDAYGARPVALVGTAVCLGAVAVLRFRDPVHAGDLRLPLALLGAGVGLANPAAQTASLSGVSGERSGMAAGVNSSMRYLGGIAGIAILGRTLDLHGARATVIASHHAVLLGFVVVLLASLLCSALVGQSSARRSISRSAAGVDRVLATNDTTGQPPL